VANILPANISWFAVSIHWAEAKSESGAINSMKNTRKLPKHVSTFCRQIYLWDLEKSLQPITWQHIIPTKWIYILTLIQIITANTGPGRHTGLAYNSIQRFQLDTVINILYCINTVIIMVICMPVCVVHIYQNRKMSWNEAI